MEKRFRCQTGIRYTCTRIYTVGEREGLLKGSPDYEIQGEGCMQERNKISMVGLDKVMSTGYQDTIRIHLACNMNALFVSR